MRSKQPYCNQALSRDGLPKRLEIEEHLKDGCNPHQIASFAGVDVKEVLAIRAELDPSQELRQKIEELLGTRGWRSEDIAKWLCIDVKKVQAVKAELRRAKNAQDLTDVRNGILAEWERERSMKEDGIPAEWEPDWSMNDESFWTDPWDDSAQSDSSQAEQIPQNNKPVHWQELTEDDLEGEELDCNKVCDLILDWLRTAGNTSDDLNSIRGALNEAQTDASQANRKRKLSLPLQLRKNSDVMLHRFALVKLGERGRNRSSKYKIIKERPKKHSNHSSLP